MRIKKGSDGRALAHWPTRLKDFNPQGGCGSLIPSSLFEIDSGVAYFQSQIAT